MVEDFLNSGNHVLETTEAEVYSNLFLQKGATNSTNSCFLIALSQKVYEKCAFNFRGLSWRKTQYANGR